MQRSSTSALFESELKRVMKKRRINNYDELADLLMVDERTLYRWRMKPESISFLTFTGIYYILCGDASQVSEIIDTARYWGINYKKDE